MSDLQLAKLFDIEAHNRLSKVDHPSFLGYGKYEAVEVDNSVRVRVDDPPSRLHLVVAGGQRLEMGNLYAYMYLGINYVFAPFIVKNSWCVGLSQGGKKNQFRILEIYGYFSSEQSAVEWMQVLISQHPATRQLLIQEGRSSI